MSASTTSSKPITSMVLIVNRQGETVRLGGGRVLVASKSEPGVWHEVTDGTCDCKGWSYRHTCRHLQALPQQPKAPPPQLRGPKMRGPYLHTLDERPDPTPPTSPASCPRCQRPTTTADARALASHQQCGACLNDLLYGPADEGVAW